MDVTDAVVVVTRWYGGIQLGPDRFKHINNVARTLLISSGIVSCVLHILMIHFMLPSYVRLCVEL